VACSMMRAPTDVDPHMLLAQEQRKAAAECRGSKGNPGSVIASTPALLFTKHPYAALGMLDDSAQRHAVIKDG
jgi:hypothetical protein